MTRWDWRTLRNTILLRDVNWTMGIGTASAKSDFGSKSPDVGRAAAFGGVVWGSNHGANKTFATPRRIQLQSYIPLKMSSFNIVVLGGK
jgi:hypothetical protein